MLKKTNHIKRFAAIIFAAFALTGCLKDGANAPEPDDGKNKTGMTFDLLVPKIGDAATRLTRMSHALENEIECVHVFFFEIGGNRTIIGHTEGIVISNNLAGLTQIRVQTEIPTGDFEVVMVANGSTMINAAIASARADAMSTGHGEWFRKAQLLKYLSVSNTDGILDTWTDSHIIMYGEATASMQEIEEGNAVRVPMTRMVAAVDFYMSDPNSAFYSILLCNQPRSGMVYPNFTDKLIPNMPPEYTRRNSYEFGFGTHETNIFVENIYPFESPATDDSSNAAFIDGSTYFIVNAKWNGAYYYYRIDFTWDGSVPGTVQGEYMPILRNHRYIVDIKEVLGKGYATADEAKKHKGILTNLNYSVHVVDEGAYGNIVYDSEYYLAVSVDKVSFTAEGGDFDLKIKTNYPYQWRASLNSEGQNTFRLGLGPAASVGTWNNASVSGSADGTLAVRSLSDPGSSHNGIITITAGKLSAYVTLKQSNQSALSLHIYDESGNDIPNGGKVEFVGNDTKARSFLVKWTPASVPLSILSGSTNGDGVFKFADDSDNLSVIMQLTDGAAILNIRPIERMPDGYLRTYSSSYFFMATYQGRSLGTTIEFKQIIP